MGLVCLWWAAAGADGLLNRLQTCAQIPRQTSTNRSDPPAVGQQGKDNVVEKKVSKTPVLHLSHAPYTRTGQPPAKVTRARTG